jgi:SecD/SecF fusion protein
LVLIFIMFFIFYGARYAFVTLVSLLVFFLVLAGFIKLAWVVLSLSAIWAIILNIGIAVDANVIIFERIKEELEKWSSISTAITNGYESSISAIRDGNMTTGLVALLLFIVWTSIFKWFGTMMMINIFIILVVMLPMIPGLLFIFSKKDNTK